MSIPHQGPSIDANPAQAFHAKCNTYNTSLDWYVDSGASAHMTPLHSTSTFSAPYIGNDHAGFGNGNILNITRIGNVSLTRDIDFIDVLVVPKFKKKNLLPISKLSSDLPCDVLFSNHNFSIQKRLTKEVLATGRVEHVSICSSLVIRHYLLN